MRLFIAFTIIVTFAIGALRVLWYPGRPLEWVYHGYEDLAHTWVGYLAGVSTGILIAAACFRRWLEYESDPSLEPIGSVKSGGPAIFEHQWGELLSALAKMLITLAVGVTTVEVIMFLIQVGL